MIDKEGLRKWPNYHLTGAQNEIFRQLTAYMESHNLSQKEVAEKLGVSSSYVSQALNGNFNFTLKKLIELALLTGKVPQLEFIDFNQFWWEKWGRADVAVTVTTSVKPFRLLLQNSATVRIINGNEPIVVEAGKELCLAETLNQRRTPEAA